MILQGRGVKNKGFHRLQFYYIRNSFFVDFGVFGASTRVQKSQPRAVKTPSRSVLNAKTPSRPYCRAKDSPQDAFKTLFQDPKPASWSNFQAFVRGNHFGMSTSLGPLSHHHLEARWRKLRSIRICFQFVKRNPPTPQRVGTKSQPTKTSRQSRSSRLSIHVWQFNPTETRGSLLFWGHPCRIFFCRGGGGLAAVHPASQSNRI